MYYHPSVVFAPKQRFLALGICAYIVVALAPWAASAQSAPDANPALSQAFEMLGKLELGQDLGLFAPIRQAVVASRSDEQVRADLEGRLVAVLQGDATDLAKDYACRQLVIVGSDASLPALSPLLPNPRMSYMARFALEGIGSSSAKKTLREMLAKTEGRQKVGVVVSLGRLADAEAVTAIAALLGEEDAELQEVCLVALGRIGNTPAADAIGAFADKAPESLHEAVVSAQLDTVESLCLRGEHKEAAEICQSLVESDSEVVRAGGFRGMLVARPTQALAMAVEGLKSNEDGKRAIAADWVAGLEEPEEIEKIASAIAECPTPGQIAALVSLKHLRHPAIRQAAWKALDQPDADVHAAALAALIRSGTADDVPALVALMKSNGDAAFETLRLMPAEGVHGAFIAWMDQAKDLPAVAVQSALSRRSPDFIPAFLRAAESSDAATRVEAFKALEIMGTEKEAPALAVLLCKTPSGEERELVGRAVWMSCQKIAEPEERSAPLLTAMAEGNGEAQCAVLPTLARIGGQEALPAVRKAMQSTDQAVRDAGYRALANWPDATIADELLEIAKTSDVDSYRIWSLRAYARVVALPSERPAQKTFEMLRDAMKLANRNEEEVLFVSRLAAVRVPDSLDLLLSFVDDTQLKAAAVPAVFTLAKGLSQSHPDQAAAALRKIQPMTQDAALLQQIPKVLRDIDARKQTQED